MHMPLTGLLVMKQARTHHELNIDGTCQYSEGWLLKFKKHNGVKHLKTCDGKVSANHRPYLQHHQPAMLSTLELNRPSCSQSDQCFCGTPLGKKDNVYSYLLLPLIKALFSS